MERLKKVADLVVEVGTNFTEDRAARLAAALAYYAMFSLAPLLTIVAGVFGRFLGEAITQEQLPGFVAQVAGQEAANFITSLITGISRPTSFTLGTIITFGILFWGASNLFHHLKETLNIVWGVRVVPGREGIIATVKGRLLAFGTVVFVGLLVITFFAINTLISYTVRLLADFIPSAKEAVPALVQKFPGFFAQLQQFSVQVLPVWRIVEIIQFVIAFFVITIFVALVYRFLPNVEISRRDVLIGAIFTSVLLTLGTIGISLYFRVTTVGSLYGAAGTIMVVLLWFYYSAQMFLVGAEFTKTYANSYGSAIRPSEHAVAVETIIEPGETGDEQKHDGADSAAGQPESELVTRDEVADSSTS